MSKQIPDIVSGEFLDGAETFFLVPKEHIEGVNADSLIHIEGKYYRVWYTFKDLTTTTIRYRLTKYERDGILGKVKDWALLKTSPLKCSLSTAVRTRQTFL